MARKNNDYYTLKAAIRYDDGRIDECRYSMTRNEFAVFFEKVCKPKGFELLSLEDIHEYRRYYS